MDVADRPLAATLLAPQSQQLLDAWKTLPLTFIGGAGVKQIQSVGLRGEKHITLDDGQTLVVDQIVLAMGLQTPNQLAASAGLAWNNGIDVHADTLATSVAGIHALGDCIAINGQVSRYIEPIGRQAKTVAATILSQASVPYLSSRVPLRIKTSSLPFTI
jgi:rubredoxin-NAD+ reductase